MIDYINKTRRDVMRSKIDRVSHRAASIFNQREVSVGHASFAFALRSALRRIRTSSSSAKCATSNDRNRAPRRRNGHLVFSTPTPRRDRDHQPHNLRLPPHQQKQAPPTLERPQGVVSSLMPSADGRAASPVGIMNQSGFIADCIVDKERRT